jgi:nicotinamide mononucleotide (NMN) deamidase PncC
MLDPSQSVYTHGDLWFKQGESILDQALCDIIQAIHDAPLQAALVDSGGGSQALAWLMSVPGATRTVLEVSLPYSYAAFEKYLGFQPEQYASQQTAEALAQVAYRRARLLAPEGTPSIGVSCTATLVTDRPKRGEHRCHIALRDEAGITTASLVLTKGARERPEEEAVVSRLLVDVLARSAGVAQSLDLHLLPGEVVDRQRKDFPDRVLHVLRGAIPAVRIDINRQVSVDLPQGVTILPGAFNPLHGGHLQLAHVASQLTNRPVYYELSVHNVDKPPLLEADVRQRIDQFYGRGALLVTTAPLFEKKSALFPGSVFVVGFDTATRLISPAYYGESQSAMLESLAAIRQGGGRFLVAGRMHSGRFRTLDEVGIPDGFRDMFEPIPPDLFRADISSTELRQQAADAV